MQLHPFHLAVSVRDIAEARAFYGGKLGFVEGRSAAHWVDYGIFGRQFVTHLDPALGATGKIAHVGNSVDGHSVPVPHFGVVLPFDKWVTFAENLRDEIDTFIIEPYIRLEGGPGEQGTMFFADPSGNALEFKGFRDIKASLFAT